MVLRIRALGNLLRDLLAFAIPTGSWWMLGIAMLIVLILVLSTATASVVPVAVYTFF